jgi:hypothetical protein
MNRNDGPKFSNDDPNNDYDRPRKH